MKLKSLLLILLSGFSLLPAQVVYLECDPGRANINVQSGRVIIENNVLRMQLINDGKKISITGFEDKITHDKAIEEPVPLFELTMADNSIITSDDFILKGKPVISDYNADQKAESFADRFPGKKYSADFENKEAGLSLHWEADLRNGSNYLRHIFSFKARDENKISGITLIKLPYKDGMRKEGTVDGSPVIYRNMFFSLEYPLSKISEDKKFISSSIPRLVNSVSTVWGVTPSGQMRRGFLYYVERERAQPYHQVLHYNSWYDISWHTRKFTEDECLDRIKMFGDSLINKRNVALNTFLFDDGWDDNKTLWKFHSGFPNGFANLKKAAEKYNAEIGVWLSPFGGYGNDKTSRIDYGKKQNPPFETNEQGFALSGPVYYKRFIDVTGDFIRDYDVSMFKFDGVGAGSGAGVIYQKDVEAFLKLITELKAIKPSLYVSMTTGTWPSVHWLKYGENIWRGGDDTNVMGEGSKRQQWITYRDADTYKNVVKRGPLYPLNSLMLCGICIADYSYPASFELIDKDISDEIWSFFATGTNLQELYINPHKLNTANWDCLAEAAKWAKENESVMTDIHWVGGDPSKGEVYGYAAWMPDKAVLSLRNPSSVEKTYVINAVRDLDIPAGFGDKYEFYDARTNDKKPVANSQSLTIKLQPFEVKVFNALLENMKN